MLPEASAAYYREQQRLTVATLALTRSTWSRMTEDFDGSWTAVGPRLTVTAMSAQLGAGRTAEPYMSAVLDELGIRDDPAGEVQPRALVGAAGDGRPVDSLLYGAVVRAKESVAAGAPAPAALDRGGRWLDMAVQTLVADTARAAVSVALTARPAVTGWVRMLNPPSCGRCAILAGKAFRWNQGFARHPRCDCRHIPSTEQVAGALTTDPRAYFASLSAAEQTKHFGTAGARAVRDGADIGQVVNARRGMTTASVGGRQLRVTTEGTTRRGVAFQALSRRGTQQEAAGVATRITSTGPELREITRTRARAPRLMPEQVYDLVGDDRREAIRLLRANGYL